MRNWEFGTVRGDLCGCKPRHITMEESDTVRNLIFSLGADLLKCGAEISRVEESMQRAAARFGIEDIEFYVVTNGLFVSFYNGGRHTGTKIRDIRYVNVDLFKLSLLNELSREISDGTLSAQEALSRLEEIENRKSDPAWRLILAAGISGLGCCYLLGASLFDCLAAFICCIIIQAAGIFAEYKGIHLSKVAATIAGSLAATLLCVFFVWLGFAGHLDYVVAGAIIPMIPGVAIVNGIRDFVDGNYLSGFVRIADAAITFFCLAIGVGLGLKLWY